MATTPNDANPRFQASPAEADRTAQAAHDDDTWRSRNVGEHVFIWLAWAMAAAFWGATLTTMAGILGSAEGGAASIGAPSLSGGSAAFLLLVVMVFVALAAALAYASLRSATRAAGSESATAAVYATIYPRDRENIADRSHPRA